MSTGTRQAVGGALEQGLWFAAPLWGAALMDGMLKMFRAQRG